MPSFPRVRHPSGTCYRHESGVWGRTPSFPVFIGLPSTTWAGTDGSQMDVWALTPEGVLRWTAMLGNTINDNGPLRDVTSRRGKYYISGFGRNSPTPLIDGWRLSNAGVLEQDFTGLGVNPNCAGIAANSDGDVFASHRIGASDAKLKKHASDGSVIWTYDPFTSLSAATGRIVPTSDGGCFAGIAAFAPTPLYSIVRLDSAGALVWIMNLGTAGAIIAPCDDGENLIAGTQRNNAWTGSGGSQANVFKVDGSTGAIIWASDTGATVVNGVSVFGEQIAISGTASGGYTTWRSFTSTGIINPLYNSGSTGANGVSVGGTNIVYIAGPRNNTWSGATGQVSAWAVEFATTATPLWTYDAGVNTFMVSV